jgi:hypothetical protein
MARKGKMTTSDDTAARLRAERERAQALAKADSIARSAAEKLPAIPGECAWRNPRLDLARRAVEALCPGLATRAAIPMDLEQRIADWCAAELERQWFEAELAREAAEAAAKAEAEAREQARLAAEAEAGRLASACGFSLAEWQGMNEKARGLAAHRARLAGKLPR